MTICHINDIQPNELWHESDIVPTIIGWVHEGKDHKIVSPYSIRSVVLEPLNCLAVIDSVYNEKNNKAYIIETNGTIIWDIKQLGYEQKGERISHVHSLYISCDNVLYFLFDKSLVT